MIATDKLLHILAGIAIAAFTLPFGVTFSVVAVLLAALFKEVYDKLSGKGTPEVMDAVATILAGYSLILWVYFLG